jgi:ribosomal protein L35
MNFSLIESNNTRSMQVKKVKATALKDCVSDALKKGHYVNNWPTKRKRILPSHDGLYCLKRGENGHLASWCAKEDGNQP